MKKTFNKFGFDLKDPDTGMQLNIPRSLNVKHDYNDKTVEEKTWESFTNKRWAFSYTSTVFNKVCCLCGSTKDVEMHHIRKVADVRHRVRTGNATYKQIVGAYKRKQVPTCKYHHIQLHKGNLNHSDIKIIAEFK
ncbi:hypothetical protein KL934_005376 (mitochondrion) [Ogataea polymorpha]|nr:hypothetical protein KL934_005376 [Ogataea polymorpha]